MNTVIIILNSIDGGTGTFLLSFLKLSKKKLNIVPCVIQRPKFRILPQSIKYIEFFNSDSAFVERYQISIENIFLVFRQLLWIRKIINEKSPSCILSVDLHTLYLVEILKVIFRYKFKHIASIHNNIRSVLQNKVSLGLKWGLLLFSRVIIKKVDILVAVSSALAEDIRSLYKLQKPPLVIQCGIPSVPRSTTIKKGINTKIIILSIARLCEQKDHHTLIEAFYRIQKNQPQSELWLAGDGPLKDDIYQQIRRLKLKNKVKLLGWIQKPERLLQIADIFVLSTKREGFPYVLLEALMAGKPIISSDCYYGPSEILDNGKYGILVPVKNSEKLAIAIKKLLANRAARLKYTQLSLERAKLFSEEIMLSKYLNLIQ